MAGDGDEPRPAADGDDALRIARLTESYRFDADLATILTEFQYRADGIQLTAATADRPLPPDAVAAPTPGVASVYEPDASLVFVCYDARGHRTLNPIETTLTAALATAIKTTSATGASTPPGRSAHAATSTPPTDQTPWATVPLGAGRLAEEPAAQHAPDADGTDAHRDGAAGDVGEHAAPSVGVVTPHNAQRGALTRALPADVTANTVEKYQGGERDIIAVSATVSDPEFARREERFILNPRRLLVAISRSRFLTIVVCSTALFEVVPEDSDRLNEGPVWTRLFTQAVGRDPEPAWTGSLAAFTPASIDEYADVSVSVYPSHIDTDGGDS